VHVAFAGGLFANYRTYLEMVVAGLNDPRLTIHVIDEPAEGALRIAARSAKKSSDSSC
jgi:N-acetylglucosamine kinase-like BadF-type ATPase